MEDEKEIIKLIREYGRSNEELDEIGSFSLLDEDWAYQLSNNITSIILCSQKQNASVVEKSIRKSIIEMLQFWCNSAELKDHEVWFENQEIMHVFIDSLNLTCTDSCDSDLIFTHELLAFYQNVQNESTVNQVEPLWNEITEYVKNTEKHNNHPRLREIMSFINVQYLQKENFEFGFKSFQNNDVFCKYLENKYISDQNRTQAIQNEAKSIQVSKIDPVVQLGYALLNINTDKSKLLLEKIIQIILLKYSSIQDSEHFLLAVLKKFERKSFEDVFLIQIWQTVPFLSENVLLNACTKAMFINNTDIMNSSTLFNDHHLPALKNKIYETIVESELKQLCRLCRKSNIIFMNASLILNGLFILKKFDARILAVIQIFLELIDEETVNETRSNVMNLYPEKYQKLLFRLKYINPNVIMHSQRNIFLETHQLLYVLYQNEWETCVLFLSHFYKWLPHFYTFNQIQNETLENK